MIHRKLQFTFLASALSVFSLASAHAQVQQQVFHNSDVSVSAFAQFTSDASGNGIKQTTTKSAGGQAAFRHSYHWWLGYEASYGYTRYAENYTGQAFAIQHNTHEFSGSYLVQGPTALGFQPFGTVGVSALVFSPSLNGGQNVSWQAKPAANFGFGINHPILTSHLGVRIQYRALFYKAPDFGESDLSTGSSRITSEPSAGVYLKF